MRKNCFKHTRRKAKFQWRICSDGKWHGVCQECDLDLNKMALKWAFPENWKEKFETYKAKVMS